MDIISFLDFGDIADTLIGVFVGGLLSYLTTKKIDNERRIAEKTTENEQRIAERKIRDQIKQDEIYFNTLECGGSRIPRPSGRG